MPWFLYALATPTLYSVTNFIEKFLLEKKIKNFYVIPFLYGVMAFLIGILIFFIGGLPKLLKKIFVGRR